MRKKVSYLFDQVSVILFILCVLAGIFERSGLSLLLLLSGLVLAKYSHKINQL